MDLIFQGSLQYLDAVMVEYHAWMTKDQDRKSATKYLKDIMTKLGLVTDIIREEGDLAHKIKVLDMDDETYHLSNQSFPSCRK